VFPLISDGENIYLLAKARTEIVPVSALTPISASYRTKEICNS
jgi:hypothetical protein